MTASESYTMKQKDIAVILHCIEMELQKHAVRTNTCANWAYVGDLGHIHELLREVLVFLIGEKNIDEVIEEHSS